MKRYKDIVMSRWTRICVLAIMVCQMMAVRMAAQEVIVSVTPVQEVLPPQLMLYLNDPGKYFNVTLINTSQRQQDVYLAMQIRQIMPASGLTVSTPPRRQPQKPFSIPAGGTRQLTMQEVKTMFNHVPSSEIIATEGLLDSYYNGSFGLLPEGQYEAQLTAYRWSQPQLAAPVAVSNPATGMAHFTVCYKAQAPQFLSPVSTSLELQDNSVAEVEALAPMFTWTQPMIACNPAAMSFRYSFKVVELMPGQNPMEAMERNPVVYRSDNLMAAQCIIPTNVVSAQLRTDRTYAAQVTASSNAVGVLNYVMIENEGKSTYRLFRIKTNDMPAEEKKDEKKDTVAAEKPDTADIGFKWGDTDLDGLINPDSLYSFSLPQITHPQFPEENGCRKAFMGNSIKVEWIEPMFRGGEGKDPGSIKIAYDVEVFRGENVADLEGALATKPIYRHRVTNTQDSIPWNRIKDVVENGVYMVLRVNPVVTHGSSVAFTGDSTHIKDFALVELLTKKFFQCSNLKDISNTTPTKLKANELRGKTVDIGEYKLTIDEISQGKKKDTWQGKGHVLWQPLGYKVHVCVQFDDLAINTDNQVYAGTAKTYAQPSKASLSDIQVVDKLFSDWGIDNLISETGIPYASELQSSATGKVKDLAKRINLSKYYGYVKKGQAVCNGFLSGEVKDLYMPLSLPKSINTSPVDIQIVSMKFAATHATMDVLGEFTLPNTSYTKNDILVLGAPRLCISPNRVLPEGGTVALLSDFTIKDPKSSYEMTFKAPKNVVEPDDGCYLAWSGDKFEILGIDVDMKVAGLVKDVNGSPSSTKERPIFNVRASIADWDDWMVDNVSVDPFQIEALPGWTFTASNIVYDHSYYRNSSKMAAFPSGYDKKKAGITGVVVNKDGANVSVTGNKDWQGLFVKEIAIKFPKSLEIGTTGDKRLSIKAQNMFFDKSGATLSVGAANILSAKTGKLGGWSFTLDKVCANFLQSNFKDCGFSGTMSVPLLSGKIGFDCRMKKMTSNANSAGRYAYVFKTQQISDMSFDFILAQATFTKEQTYFLLESVPDASGTQQTSVELMMGGKITIGGTDYLNKKASSLPMKFSIPGVNFCGMRLSNKSNTWKSTYESAMQSTAKNAKLSGKQIYAGKEIVFSSGKIYFHTGKWSLASPEKKVGPFTFSLDKYKFDYSASSKKLSTTLDGSIKFIDGIELSAGAGITINSKVTLPSDLSKLSDIKLSYDKTTFNKLSVDTKFAGMQLSGSLDIKNESDKEGYGGTLKFTMPGDLFAVNASGGYYKYKSGSYSSYKYGFFYCKAATSLLRCDPVVINSITAGFYYNCKKKSDTECTPQKDVFGVVAGLGLSTTAGKEMLNADLDMTAVYDKKRNRLSTFIFNGKVKAVSELVSASCNMVYENNSSSRYLQLDVTVDASADAEKIATAVSGSEKTLSSLKKTLNSSYSLSKKEATGDMSSLKDQDGTPDARKSSKNGESCSAAIGAKVSLNVKITWREKGTNYNKPHWHLYLGEPSFSKRCSFTFLKFKSKVVSVDFGANGYVCVGNELPNNGKLPDIPDKIRNFLNGGGDSKGIESADIQKANRAREGSLKEFNDQITKSGGGVMFGSQVWGYVNVDLGVFYLYTGATAGFDISIIKLPSNAYCTNISGQPGYKGWYGYGQLYAYLYAKFGIKINLGFWKHNFDVCDAGIGGLFSFQGPKPSHFDGQARVKLKLLGGLVNVNRRFSFSCGKGCDLFYGNALDNFELFGDLSIGYAEKEKGWQYSNALNPRLMQKPQLYTQAPLEQPFRVVDETEKARLRKNYAGDASDLDAQASRTFYFRSGASSCVTVYEYPDSVSAYRGTNATTRTWRIQGTDGTTSVIDMTQLNSNRWYKMVVSGYAKEIQNGKEVDPVNYNEQKKKYENKPWNQSKTYYFRTIGYKSPGDCPDLQDYVAIAYPSYYNQLKSEEGVRVHGHDMQYPTIALLQDLSSTSFKKGTLYWRLYSGKKMISESKNKWITTGNTCNMTPDGGLSSYNNFTYYNMKLEYVTSKTVNGKVEYNTTELMNLKVYTDKNPTDWRFVTEKYEKPFVGARINNVTFSKTPRRINDYEMSREYYLAGRLQRLYDPYLYIAYLANYGFFGGWEFDADRITLDVTTAQSLIYNDKGGVYEGKLGAKESYNCMNDYEKIKHLSIYDYSQWGKFCSYPLPVMEDSKYNYVMGGLPRANGFRAGVDKQENIRGYLYDMIAPYYAAERLCVQIWNYTKQMDKIDANNKSFTSEANGMEDWYYDRVGTYCTASCYDASLMVPAYQFPIVWGSMLKNKDSRKKLTAWGTLKGYSSAAKSYKGARGHESNSEWVFGGFLGKNNVKGDSGGRTQDWNHFKAEDCLSAIENVNYSIYRVNAYDFVNCEYKVITTSNGLYGSIYFQTSDLRWPLRYTYK